MDKNENNLINEIEIVPNYIKSKTNLKKGEAKKLLNRYDKKLKGSINLEEFIEWSILSNYMEGNAVKKSFKKFKRNREKN